MADITSSEVGLTMTAPPTSTVGTISLPAAQFRTKAAVRVFPNVAEHHLDTSYLELAFKRHAKSASGAPIKRDLGFVSCHRPTALRLSKIFLHSGHTGNLSGFLLGTHFFPHKARTGAPVTADRVISVLLT